MVILKRFVGTRKKTSQGHRWIKYSSMNKSKKKSFKKKELQDVLEKGQKIEKRTYEGCPRHKPTTEGNILDMFA